jgi:hypothetical protein
MDFRRSGQLDERRRRVLMDEIAAPSADAEKSQPTAAKGPVRAYNESVLSDRQRRVSDFIPVRPFKVVALILLLLTAVAGIEALYIFTAPPGGFAILTKARHPHHALGDQPFAALDLAARGNIGSWFSSLLFAGGMLTILGLLSIRAHRVDDYKGRYRIWWWVAAAFAWASIDVATGLHDALGQGVQLLAGDNLPGGRTLLWIGVSGVAFGTLGIRAAFEVWSSLLAVVFSSVAALLYFACIALSLDMIPLEAGTVLKTVIASSLTLLAHVCVVTSVVLYARHVHLDAQGRLMVSADPAAKAKKKSKSKAKLAVVSDDDDEKAPAAKDKKSESKKEEPKKDDARKEAPAAKPAAASGLKFGSSSAPAASASISNKTNTTPIKQNDDDDDEDEDEDEDDRISRAEKKRLKKLARRDPQQRRAA